MSQFEGWDQKDKEIHKMQLQIDKLTKTLSSHRNREKEREMTIKSQIDTINYIDSYQFLSSNQKSKMSLSRNSRSQNKKFHSLNNEPEACEYLEEISQSFENEQKMSKVMDQIFHLTSKPSIHFLNLLKTKIQK